MTEAEGERKLALMRACWTYFDETWPRISPELRKGPRGGGRDRDQIVWHTYGSELEFAGRIGLSVELDAIRSPEGLRDYRQAYQGAIRACNAEGRPARSWTLPFLIRRTCVHLLGHAWELEDKDVMGRA
jgi:hypothetical protein